MSLDIDQLIVSDTKRPGCPDPFEDDNGNVHEPALNELKAWDIYRGCAEMVACVEDPLSRYAMAVLLDRALELPATEDDFFDDDSLWAEPHINRVAAAGITLGCEPTLFCPHDEITRAHFAVMLHRAFRPPPSPVDYFSDDDGIWLESATNALAHAGITLGCRPGEFCLDDSLTRGQAASLIHRALEWAEGQS